VLACFDDAVRLLSEVTERGKDLVSHYHRNSGQPPAAEEEDLSDAVPSGEEDDISDAGPDAYAGPGALSWLGGDLDSPPMSPAEGEAIDLSAFGSFKLEKADQRFHREP
jgi:hypothetical protein